MRFFERPFVFLVPLFCFGLILSDLLEWNFWMTLPLILIFLWATYRSLFKQSNSLLFYFVVITGFIFCGAVSMNIERTSYSIASYGEEEVSIIGEITEIDNSKRLWVRSVFTISGVLIEDKIIPHHEKIVCYVNVPNLELNDKLFIRKKIWPIRNLSNPGEFNSKSYWYNKGISSSVFVTEGDYKLIDKVPVPFYENWRRSIKDIFDGIFSYYLRGKELAIASALVLGDKSLIDNDLKQSFGAAGAMHVLAVSGLHIGIILELLLFLFGRIPKIFSKKRALISALIVLWIYAMIIGFPPSVVRATLMFTLLSIGRLSSQQSDSLNILCFSALAMLLVQPLLIYNIGFQLSYLAMFGILTLQKPMAALIYVPNKWLRKLWEGTTVGIAAQLFTFPLTLYYFHQFPNYFLLTNIGMMIFAGIVLSLGLILLSINWIGVLGKFVAIIFGFSISIMLFFVQWIEGLPWALANGFVLSPWTVISAYLIPLALLLFRKRKHVPKIALSLGVVLLVYIQYNRLSRMSKQEITLFNSSQLIIAVKDGATTTFFYSAYPERSDKVKILGSAYLKTNSTRGKYVYLKNGITTFESPRTKLTFDMSDYGILVTRHPDSMQFYVRTTVSAPYLENMTNFTMNYLPVTPDAIGLIDGAYTMPLLE